MKPQDELAGLLPPVTADQQLPHRELHKARLLAAIAAESGRPRPWWPARPRLGGRWPGAKSWLIPASAAIGVAAVAAVAVVLSLTVFGRPAKPAPPTAGRMPRGGVPAGRLTAARHWQQSSAGLRGVVVRANTGSVAVIGGASGSAVAITAQPRYQGPAPVVSTRISDGVLTISVLCPRRAGRQSCSVAVRVSLPRSIAIRASTNVGSVHVSNMAGLVTVADNVGPIELRHLSGTVSAADNLGAIDGQGLSSRQVVLSAQAGEIDVSFAAVPDRVDATDKTGLIVIDVPTSASYRVSASAQLGGVTVTVPRSANSAHVITAASQLGSVTVAG